MLATITLSLTFHVTQANGLPGLGRSTFQQTSNLVLGIDSKTRIVSADITLEVVVVAQVGCFRLGIHVFLGTRADKDIHSSQNKYIGYILCLYAHLPNSRSTEFANNRHTIRRKRVLQRNGLVIDKKKKKTTLQWCVSTYNRKVLLHPGPGLGIPRHDLI